MSPFLPNFEPIQGPMKNIFNTSLTLIILTVLIACGEDPNPDVVFKQDEYQQMIKETASRDSAMLELVKTLNLIDENMEKITERKNKLKMPSGDVENRQSYREKVLDEIQEIYEIMQQNKEKIDQLNIRLADTRNRLNKSDADLKHANALIAQYQAMIDNMTKKMQRKDEEIYMMKEELANMNISLDSLKTEYSKQHEEMNVVYFAFGSKKELLYHNIVDKEGGFIGIGKTLTIKDNFDKSYFTKADAEELESIDLFVKKAEILSTHRDGSYHLEKNEDKIEKLVIDDKKAFWEASKYLVIQVEQ